METKELKITIPEGYEIDKKNSTFEKIVFKKKENTKPRSWEEYLIEHNHSTENPFLTLPNENLAKAFLAMMKLVSLREDWIEDWKPDWNDDNKIKYCFGQSRNIIRVYDLYTSNHILSFPTEEMAEDFMNCFKDLLDAAKPLI